MFFPRCLSGALQPPGACMSFTYKDTGPEGVTGPEANSKLVAKLGNKLLD